MSHYDYYFIYVKNKPYQQKNLKSDHPWASKSVNSSLPNHALKPSAREADRHHHFPKTKPFVFFFGYSKTTEHYSTSASSLSQLIKLPSPPPPLFQVSTLSLFKTPFSLSLFHFFFFFFFPNTHRLLYFPHRTFIQRTGSIRVTVFLDLYRISWICNPTQHVHPHWHCLDFSLS